MERVELARRLGAPAGATVTAAGPRLIEERDPGAFMERFAGAVAGGGDVFLVDPTWPAEKRSELERLLLAAQPGDAGRSPAGRGWLMIPSGGTSGRLKFARHDGETLAAAVAGFQSHFGFERVNAVGVLPLHHVSGLMAWLRCAVTGGRYVPWDWKRLEAGDRPATGSEGGAWTLSLVPTQLQRLVASPAACAWLRGFAAVFVGGGPSWPELLDAAATERLPIALSYGMTETAAMVAALRPSEFAAGLRTCGPALPQARLTLDAEGRVAIAGASLFRGYYPGWRPDGAFVTDDLGTLDARGHLTVLGRRDAAIITGGRKVQPGDVEAALRASGEFDDVVVLGLPDREWGEIVAAFHPAARKAPDYAHAIARLAAWQRPKRFIAVPEWPRNAQGKVDRVALRARADAPGSAAPA